MKTKRKRKKTKYSYVGKLVEGRKVVSVKVSSDKTNYGFIDEAGEEIVPCEYSAVWDYENGYARVAKEIGADKKVFWACINLDGDIVIPLKYKIINPLDNGFMQVYLEKKWGAFHLASKKLIIPMEYDWIFPWKENSFVFRKGNKYGALNEKGEEVIPPIYDRLNSSSEGLFQACINKKWGFIDVHNNVVFPFIYTGVWPFENNQAQVYIDGEYGFIRKE